METIFIYIAGLSTGVLVAAMCAAGKELDAWHEGFDAGCGLTRAAEKGSNE